MLSKNPLDQHLSYVYTLSFNILFCFLCFYKSHTQIGKSTEINRRYIGYDVTRNSVILTKFCMKHAPITPTDIQISFSIYKNYNIQFRSRPSEHVLFEYVIANFIFTRAR